LCPGRLYKCPGVSGLAVGGQVSGVHEHALACPLPSVRLLAPGWPVAPRVSGVPPCVARQCPALGGAASALLTLARALQWIVCRVRE
jgi:hypothetical protein